MEENNKPTIETDGNTLTINGEDKSMKIVLHRKEKGVIIEFISREPVALTNAAAQALCEALKI